uniref:hypothetical protein n=1 Tax=Neorhizobium sp. EC2-8 TaxID=3129230 RepID=UPI003101014A
MVGGNDDPGYPGPTVVTRNPEFFCGIITSMRVGNLMLVLLNLPLIVSLGS